MPKANQICAGPARVHLHVIQPKATLIESPDQSHLKPSTLQYIQSRSHDFIPCDLSFLKWVESPLIIKVIHALSWYKVYMEQHQALIAIAHAWPKDHPTKY